MDKPEYVGNGEPNLIKPTEEINNPTEERTNKDPVRVEDLTGEDLAVIFEFFDYLRKARDLKDGKLDGLEPEKTTQDEENQLKEKVG